MIDAQKPSSHTLKALVGRLCEGCFVVPDFQREFEWKPYDIQELMKSIFLDYYIGSLLLWKGTKTNFRALACQKLYGFDGDPDRTHIVLDGQQRLTAMHYVFMAPDKPLPKRSNRFLYFIRADRFMEENYDEAFEYDWTKRGKNILEDENVQFKEHLFPLKVIGDLQSDQFALPNWLQHYKDYWLAQQKEREAHGDKAGADVASRHAANAEKFAKHVGKILDNYLISYIELDCDLEIEKVCDIFTKINSRGIPLNIFDLMNAVLKPGGIQLKHMYREVKSRLDFVETDSMNVYILQVMSILLQEYCSPKYLYYLRPGHEKKVRDDAGHQQTKILVETGAEFKDKWSQAVKALEQAVELLRHPSEFGVITPQYLPYASILPVFSALGHTARQIASSLQLKASEKISDWYWASVFQQRYSSAAETTAARDYRDLTSWFEDDSIKPKIIEEFSKQYRNLDLYAETRRGSSIYKGIFNLLVLSGARDWISGSIPLHNLDDHHIVPQKWGKDNKCQPLVDSILNRTLLTADTNRKFLRDELPCKYLPRMFNSNGEENVRKILELHLIPESAIDILLKDTFTEENLKAFLDKRRLAILDAIEKFCFHT